MSSDSAATTTPIFLDVPRFPQPDDLTCGPTCLAQVYGHFGVNKSVEDVIRETPRNPDGGTLAVYLGISAMKNGFRATIYSYNLLTFDPTWRDLNPEELTKKLARREAFIKSESLRRSLQAYRRYLRMGGEVRFAELEPQLLLSILASGRPILTGLSATYLYQTQREYNNEYDDIRGEPVGHFVVICGYYPKSRRFVVRDPASHIPFSRTGKYSVPAQRLLNAILLGDVTYDSVLLILDKG